MSQEIRIKLFINSSYNTFPKYIFIPSQAMIFFVFISTLVDKDTGLCIGPVDHFQNNQKAIHLEKKIFLYGRIWNAFYKYYLDTNLSTTLYYPFICRRSNLLVFF